MAIRVLHLIGSLRLGGAQVVVKQIVENASEDVEHFVYPLRSRTIDIPIKGNVLSNPYRNYDPRKFFDILKICKKHNIDIIHAHLHKPILGALLTTYFQNIPLIVHEHGPISRRGIQYSAYRLILRLLKKRAKQFIAVSNAIATQLNQYSGVAPVHIRVVHNAVDLKKFVPNPELRQSIRGELGIAPEDIVIGFVGRLSYVKGPDILLEAFKALAQERRNLQLIYLGTGKMAEQLQATAQEAGLSERVRFLGFQENVSEIMNIFDIGCMPSRQEPFGIVALEMMNMGLPLISSGVDGLAEITENYQNAIVLENIVAPEVAARILELIQNPQLQEGLRKNASVYCQKFSIKNLVNNIEGIYKSFT